MNANLVLTGVVALCAVETLVIVWLLLQRAKREGVEESLVERLTFERLAADLSATFINLPEDQVRANTANALGRIAEFFKIERITLYELAEAKTELTATSWVSDGTPPTPTIASTDALPASVPLKIGGEIIGALKFARTTGQLSWTEDLVSQLTLLAAILANAVARQRSRSDLLSSIGELKRTEAVLRESEERFRLVANTAPVMIWMADCDKLCTYFNQPWLDFVGRPMSAELGNGWADGVHAEDLEGCLQTYTEAFDRRDRFAMHYRLRRHDGEYRWLLDNGVPRFDQNGVFAGYIGSCIDVTDSKAAKDALESLGGRLLEAQEQERSRIARELHDDISQRLALLAIELQQMDFNSPAGIRSRSEELFQHIGDISADVQSLSHQLHSSKLEYLGVVAAMRGFCVEFAAQQPSVTIDFKSGDVPADLPQAVSVCLFRVLQEGLRNAVKYSGVLHVEARLRGTSTAVVLTIRDRGRGFDPGVAMRGRGLGLISMRERASLVNGTILITSKPAWGTEISVQVPIDPGVGAGRKALAATKNLCAS